MTYAYAPARQRPATSAVSIILGLLMGAVLSAVLLVIHNAMRHALSRSGWQVDWKYFLGWILLTLVLLAAAAMSAALRGLALGAGLGGCLAGAAYLNGISSTGRWDDLLLAYPGGSMSTLPVAPLWGSLLIGGGVGLLVLASSVVRRGRGSGAWGNVLGIPAVVLGLLAGLALAHDFVKMKPDVDEPRMILDSPGWLALGTLVLVLVGLLAARFPWAGLVGGLIVLVPGLALVAVRKVGKDMMEFLVDGLGLDESSQALSFDLWVVLGTMAFTLGIAGLITQAVCRRRSRRAPGYPGGATAWPQPGAPGAYLASPQQGYAPPQQGYTPPQQGYAPAQRGYTPAQPYAVPQPMPPYTQSPQHEGGSPGVSRTSPYPAQQPGAAQQASPAQGTDDIETQSVSMLGTPSDQSEAVRPRTEPLPQAGPSRPAPPQEHNPWVKQDQEPAPEPGRPASGTPEWPV